MKLIMSKSFFLRFSNFWSLHMAIMCVVKTSWLATSVAPNSCACERRRESARARARASERAREKEIEREKEREKEREERR